MKMEEERGKTRGGIDNLFLEVRKYRSNREYQDLLDFVGRFRSVAPYNAMLLNIQRPGSKYVATVKEWKRKFGRTIKVGAMPLMILIPFGPVKFVYELSDTEGKDFPQELLDPFSAHDGTVSVECYQKLVNEVKYDGILCSERDYGNQMCGLAAPSGGSKYQYVEKKSKRYKISVLYEVVLNRNSPVTTRFTTLVHELGHIYCGHLGSCGKSWLPDRRAFAEAEIPSEFEAESVSWMICQRLGVLGSSDKYLHARLGDGEEIPRISPETVLKAANLIDARLSGKVRIREDITGIEQKEPVQKGSWRSK